MMLNKLNVQLKKVWVSQRGAMMVFVAILMTFFLAMIGFGLDAGRIYMEKAKLQDIADAEALAGAIYLNQPDSEGRRGKILSSLRAYSAANGFQVEATSSEFDSVDEYDADKEPAKDGFRIAHKVVTQKDKDDVERERLYVRIKKSVPTFFIKLMLPEYANMTVSAVAAAEYVEGQEVISYEGPKIVCNMLDYQVYDSDTVVVKNGTDFSIYAGASTIDYNKLPKTTSSVLYNTNWGDGTGKLPNGWTLIRTNEDKVWNLDDPREKAEKEALDEAQALITKKSSKYKAAADKYVAEKQDYINGVGNKRYIGHDSNGQAKIVSNIKDDDDNIDLYVDGTLADALSGSTHNSTNYAVILTNRQIKNVKHVNTLILGKHVANWGSSSESEASKTYTIATEGITFGNIYTTSASSAVYISGKENYFNGLIFVQGRFYVGGTANHYNNKNSTELFVIGNMYLGTSHDVKDTNNATDGSRIWVGADRKEDSSWHMYWDGNASSSDGTEDASDTKAHVRLIE